MRLYSLDADWWPIISPAHEYDELALACLAMLQDAVEGDLGRLMELGCGYAPMADHWPDDLQLTLVDMSPDMLALAAERHPRATTLKADMRELSLDEPVDAILLQDAVMYLLSRNDLQATFRAAFGSLRPGGAFLVVPDIVKEAYEETTLSGGGEAEDGRAFRMQEWHFDPDPSDHTTQAAFSYMLRWPDGRVEHHGETHTMGLFSVHEIQTALEQAGFELLQPDILPAGLPFLARKPV